MKEVLYKDNNNNANYLINIKLFNKYINPSSTTSRNCYFLETFIF